MKHTHTPGPWTHTPSREHVNTSTTRRDIVAASQFGPAFVAGDVSQADARLISAAPELLSALESLAVWTDDTPCFCHVHGERERARYSAHDSYCDKARAAIAKAKGGVA